MRERLGGRFRAGISSVLIDMTKTGDDSESNPGLAPAAAGHRHAETSGFYFSNLLTIIIRKS
jgi:hypothetical protein